VCVCVRVYVCVCPLITREPVSDCLQIFRVAPGHLGDGLSTKNWREVVGRGPDNLHSWGGGCEEG